MVIQIPSTKTNIPDKTDMHVDVEETWVVVHFKFNVRLQMGVARPDGRVGWPWVPMSGFKWMCVCVCVKKTINAGGGDDDDVKRVWRWWR